MRSKYKALSILLLFALLSTLNVTSVSAQETDFPVIEEISFTDGGAGEIDELEMASPINIIADELLLLIICSDNAGATDYFNPVVGWTKLGESGNAVCDSHIAVYWQVANGSQVNTNVTGTTVSNMLGWILRISGVDTNDTIEASNFAASTAAGINPQIVPSVTTLKDNTLVLYGLSFDGGDGYPMNVVSPFTELADRTNTGTPTEAYASGTIGYRELAVRGISTDAIVYTANVDGASYFQLAINGDILSTDTVTLPTGLLADLFLSTEIYGYFGPFILVAIGYVLAMSKKYRFLALLWFIVECLFMSYYFTLIEAGTAFYWWHIVILLLGGIFGCLLPVASQK